MGIDVDYLAGKRAIEELEQIFGDLEHGERSEMADEIIDFVLKMKKLHTNKIKKSDG